MHTQTPTTADETDEQPANLDSKDYFAATIGDYHCHTCGTEFSINTLLLATRDLAGGIVCPICGTHADADALEFDPAADREGVAQ